MVRRGRSASPHHQSDGKLKFTFLKCKHHVFQLETDEIRKKKRKRCVYQVYIVFARKLMHRLC